MLMLLYFTPLWEPHTFVLFYIENGEKGGKATDGAGINPAFLLFEGIWGMKTRSLFQQHKQFASLKVSDSATLSAPPDPHL